MKARAKWLPAASLLLAACSVSPPLPELPPTHPASAAAPEAPRLMPTQTLRMAGDAAKPPAAEPTARPHEGHGGKR